jgi:general secretion pathway protein A
MYEEFYGLKEKPFSLTPDPRFFFLSENHREAFEHLLYGIKEKEGFILITGEVGAGKTTLCRALLDKIESSAIDSALILNPMLSDYELLQSILNDFGIQSRALTKKGLLDDLNQFLLRQQAADRNSILIIDEAQNLPPFMLEEIRILSNLETEKEKLLQIILIGQVELKEKLSLPQLRQLNQRISIRYHLQNLRKEEVARYIQHRLTVAGSTGDIHFSSAALREIYDYSRGIPRLTNLAADRALLAGYADQTRDIRRSTVIKGLKSLKGEVINLSRGFFSRMLRDGLAGLLIFFLGLSVATIFLGSDRALSKKIRGIYFSDSSSSVAEAKAQPAVAQGNSFYTLQLGSYKSRDEALEIAARVKATGYPIFVARPGLSGGEKRHLLYLGKFYDRTEAEVLERAFRKVNGFSGVHVVLASTETSQAAP